MNEYISFAKKAMRETNDERIRPRMRRRLHFGDVFVRKPRTIHMTMPEKPSKSCAIRDPNLFHISCGHKNKS